MNPETRAAELAQAAQSAHSLFFFIVIGTLAIIVFWMLVAHAIERYERRRRRRQANAFTQRWHDSEPVLDELAWAEWCDEQDVPTETRLSLMMSVRR